MNIKRILCCCKKEKKSLQYKALQKLKKEMNIVTILKKLHKLEAGLSAVLGNKKLIQKSKLEYFKSCSLASSIESEVTE